MQQPYRNQELICSNASMSVSVSLCMYFVCAYWLHYSFCLHIDFLHMVTDNLTVHSFGHQRKSNCLFKFLWQNPSQGLGLTQLGQVLIIAVIKWPRAGHSVLTWQLWRGWQRHFLEEKIVLSRSINIHFKWQIALWSCWWRLNHCGRLIGSALCDLLPIFDGKIYTFNFTFGSSVWNHNS